MSDSSNTILGILAGTAIGAALGILFAPDKGSNTRKKLIEEGNAAIDTVSENASNLKQQVVSSVSSGKNTLDEKVETLVSDASYKTEDMIVALERKLKDLKAKNRRLQKQPTV